MEGDSSAVEPMAASTVAAQGMMAVKVADMAMMAADRVMTVVVEDMVMMAVVVEVPKGSSGEA
jgi:hypothetical protein